MPLELKAKNPKVEVTYRFVGKNIFLKSKSVEYAAQLIQQIKSKGGVVQQGRRNWIKCNILGDHKVGTFLNNTIRIDITQDTDSQIENKFCEFFKQTLKQQQFIVEVKQI